MTKRFLGLILTLSVLTALMPQSVANAQAGIEIGDYIQMGTYYGKPILWRCVDIDENGPLMLSDRILCLKAFDAKGDNKTGSHNRGNTSGQYRRRYGSNYWADSNIRCWLNSKSAAGNIEWICGNSPDEDHVLGGYNAYENEAGFLTNFNSCELMAMKAVMQKSLLDRYEYTNMSSYGEAAHAYSSSIHDVVRNYDNAYSELVTDTVFLLDVKQVNKVFQNGLFFNWDKYYIGVPTEECVANSEYKSSDLDYQKYWSYWLRTPCSDSYTGYSVCYVSQIGDVNFYDAYDSLFGVRPAFYLDMPCNGFAYGSGTEDDPYRLANTEKNDFVTEITPVVGVHKIKNNISYDFFIKSGANISGIFMMGIYDSLGRLLKMEVLDNIYNEKEKEVSGLFEAPNSTYLYKTFLWNNIEDMMPLATTVSEIIE